MTSPLAHETVSVFVCPALTSALVSTVASLVLYAVCAAAAIKLKAMGGLAAVAVLALVYALAMFVGAGLEATLWGLGLAIAGLPIRYFSRRFNSGAATPAPAPDPAAPRE